MEQNIEFIAKPKELFLWMQEQEKFYDMSEEAADVLLGYLDGHDYAIGRDASGKLYWMNLAEDDVPAEEILLDEVIDRVCEFNFSLITDTEEKLAEVQSQTEEEELKAELEQLKKDEVVLDHLFDQTAVAIGLDRLAEKWANEILASLQKDRAADVTGILKAAVYEVKEGGAR